MKGTDLGITKDSVGKVASLAIHDDFNGMAEILEVNEDSFKLQWISGTACYSSQVYSEALYTQPLEFKYSDVDSYGDEKVLSQDEVKACREQSLKDDAGIFRRYAGLQKEMNAEQVPFDKEQRQECVKLVGELIGAELVGDLKSDAYEKYVNAGVIGEGSDYVNTAVRIGTNIADRYLSSGDSHCFNKYMLADVLLTARDALETVGYAGGQAERIKEAADNLEAFYAKEFPAVMDGAFEEYKAVIGASEISYRGYDEACVQMSRYHSQVEKNLTESRESDDYDIER